MRRRFPIAVRVFTVALISASPAIASATTTVVPAGGNLQEALTNARPGDAILLEPGATYVGNFTLPVKPGAVFITVETSPGGLPGDGVRVSPAQSASLAKLRS